ncbi:hypothetical protein NBD62_22060, partial [Salmonella sp. C3304]
MGSCAAPSAKGDDKFITTDYLQQCRISHFGTGYRPNLHPGFQLADFHIISLSQHELRHKN